MTHSRNHFRYIKVQTNGTFSIKLARGYNFVIVKGVIKLDIA